MNGLPVLVVNAPRWGGPLIRKDHEVLERSWITSDLAEQAMLRRVCSPEGSSIVGRHDNGTYAGIVFPYVWPGEHHIREYWLRRDQPDIEYDKHGLPKEKNKYLGPVGRGNLLYFVPGTANEFLEEVQIPLAITEGVKKTLALHRLSWYGPQNRDRPRFLPLGLNGVWNWRGTIGKTPGPDGSRRDEKGPIPDLGRITWKNRRVYIVFDANVRSNTSVAAARQKLSGELRSRGAKVVWINLPAPDRGDSHD